MPENEKLCGIYTDDANWIKYCITASLTLAWMCLGYFTELLGPFLKTLMVQLNTDYGGIGTALSVRSAGFFTGSLFGGIICDIHTRFLHLLLVVSLLCAALTTAVIPHCTSLGAFCFILFIAGIAHGLLSSAGNPLMSHTWTTKASGPFNLMHSGYGVGGAITALIIKALEDPLNKENEHLDILPPMIIATCASSLMAIPFLLLFLRHLKLTKYFIESEEKIYLKGVEKHSDDQDKIETFINIPERFTLMIKFKNIWIFFRDNMKLWVARTELKRPILILYILVIYFCLMGNERVASKFLYTYIQSGEHGTDKQDALLVQSAFWGVYCLGRFIIFLLSFKIKINHLYIAEITGALLSSACFAFAPRQRESLISCVLLFALFKSPLFPSTIGVFGQICRITGFIVLFIDIGSSLGGITYQIVAAKIIQYSGITVFPYILFGTVVVIFPFSTFLTYIVHKDIRNNLDVKK